MLIINMFKEQIKTEKQLSSYSTLIRRDILSRIDFDLASHHCALFTASVRVASSPSTVQI